MKYYTRKEMSYIIMQDFVYLSHVDITICANLTVPLIHHMTTWKIHLSSAWASSLALVIHQTDLSHLFTLFCIQWVWLYSSESLSYQTVICRVQPGEPTVHSLVGNHSLCMVALHYHYFTTFKDFQHREVIPCGSKRQPINWSCDNYKILVRLGISQLAPTFLHPRNLCNFLEIYLYLFFYGFPMPCN